MVLPTSRRGGIGRRLRPSAAARVGREANGAVLYVPIEGRGFVDPNDGHLTLRQILLPVSEGSTFSGALFWAKWIAETLGDSPAKIQLLRAKGSARNAEKAVQLANRASDSWQIESISRPGSEIDGTLDASKEADLVVLALTESDQASGSVLGRRLDRVLQQISCPLLVIPSA